MPRNMYAGVTHFYHCENYTGTQHYFTAWRHSKIKFKQRLIFIIHNSACLMMMKNDHFIPLQIFSWALFDCILTIKNYRSSMIFPRIAQANMFNVDTSQKTIINPFPGKLTLYLPFFINGFDITTGFILFCVILI